MIIKSKTHKSAGAYADVLSYVLRKNAQFKDSFGKSLLIKHNLTGKTIYSFTSQFRENLTFRKYVIKTNINIIHDILSLHPKDSNKNITSDMLQDLTKKYIELKNDKGMYLATAHSDKDHIHVHIVGSPLEVRNGKSIRMSKAEFSKIQQEMQIYQQLQYPSLFHSVVNYGKSKKK